MKREHKLLHFKVIISCIPVFVYDQFIKDIASMLYSLLSVIDKDN